ncbi:MAG: PqiC family protein [Thermodesulfobacteriota bacterium]|nr:PqiC family protein [Thermodesulfobacteriota bacterium]
MKMIHARVVIAVFFLMTIVGCTGTSQPSKFYLLTSLADSGSGTEKARIAENIAIGVGPVKLPEYLERPQIITRTSENELHLAEFDRWAGSLSEDVSRVLAENIATLLGIDRIVIYPWRRSSLIDYQIEVNVLRLEGSLGGDVFLKTRWAIFSDNGKKIHIVKTSQIRESTSDRTYTALVAGESRALERLSSEISVALGGLLSDKSD